MNNFDLDMLLLQATDLSTVGKPGDEVEG
jgi:hypothetical protein